MGYTSYIANAYHSDIEVKVNDIMNNQTSQQSSSKFSAKGSRSFGSKGAVSASGKASVGFENSQGSTYETNQERGFTPIRSGDFLQFDVSSGRGNVFVSIKSGSRKIADDYPLSNDYSIIVDAHGYVQRARYGKIWIDQKGIDHSRLN